MTLTKDASNFITIVTVMSTVSTAFAITRLIIRRRGLLGKDDYILAFAVVMVWVQAAGAFILNILGGVGKPFSTLQPDEITWLYKMFFWPELGYTILVASVKMSILLSYKRIFGHYTWTRIHINIMMVLVVSWGLAIFFTCVFQCWPVDKAWEPLKPGSCINLISFLWGNSVSNLIIDWMILLVPAWPVWQLRMDRAQKMLVGGSFALGSLACVASTVRAATTGSIDISDLSKSVFMASVWTYIEPNLAIISACLPFIGKPVGRRIAAGLEYARILGSKATSRLALLSTRSSNRTNAKGDPRTSQNVTRHTEITVQRAGKRSEDSHELQQNAVFAAGTHESEESGLQPGIESAHSLI
ncbi:hypothetical protein BJ166DRAFT_110017 [Pestalotiopsis sp. NC0098]|nr:hypothetical protein BJ166DRAFT_110017 [Pestalotiopsis sp. NC0098]